MQPQILFFALSFPELVLYSAVMNLAFTKHVSIPCSLYVSIVITDNAVISHGTLNLEALKDSMTYQLPKFEY